MPTREHEKAFAARIFIDGFAVVPEVFDDGETVALAERLKSSTLRRTRAGARHAMRDEAVARVARDSRLLHLAQQVLGDGAIPFRATLFDKSPASNWLVVWHQDTALPLRERRESPGWGPWSVKDEVNYAHAPASALERILALRLHLDDSSADNGPLRVLPATHNLGVLSDSQLHDLPARVPPIECLTSRGGVLAMRPLIVHASSKSQSEMPRRVLHIEYAETPVLDDRLCLVVA